jgi:sugar phosphate isomerase/epimerase
MNASRLYLVLPLFAGLIAPAVAAQPSVQGLPNPFYAMDTYTKRPYPKNDIPPAAQLDLLKELGYAGIAWTEEEPGQVKTAAELAEKRGLKMFAIYCAATAGPKGLTYPERLQQIIKILKGHDTIIWLHIGGKGPDFAALTSNDSAVRDLRALADLAAANSLKIAVYPHVGEWTERVQNAVRLARTVDRKNFGVTFNLCHCLAMGDEAKIPALLEEAAPFLFTVTINGADAGVERPQWNRLIQPLGRGTYDVGIVLRKLKQLNFRGPIGLQGFGVPGDRRANLAESLAAWHKLSRAAATQGSKGAAIQPEASLHGHKHTISCLAFSPDGRWLASGSKDTFVRQWDLKDGKAAAVLDGHVDMVVAVAFSPDSKMLASSSHGSIIHLWDRSGKEIRKLEGHAKDVRGLAFSRNSKRLASASADHTIRLWDLDTGQASLVLKGHTAEVNCVSYSRDGKLLASGGWDKTVRLWDSATGKLLATLEGHTDMVRDVVFTPDRQSLISSGKDGIIRIWDVAGKKLAATLQGHQGLVRSLALSPDGKVLASAGKEGVLNLWELESRKLRTSLDRGRFAFQVVAFAPDGRTLATGGIDREVHLWHVPQVLKTPIDSPAH